MVYVLLLYEGDYEDSAVSAVRILQDRAIALAEARKVASDIKAQREAVDQWAAAVEVDYHRLKPEGWDEFYARSDPNTFDGKHAHTWRKAAKLHEFPMVTPYTSVTLFEADETSSVGIEV